MTLFKQAHELTRRMKAVFPEVDYKAQFVLCIQFLKEGNTIEDWKAPVKEIEDEELPYRNEQEFFEHIVAKTRNMMHRFGISLKDAKFGIGTAYKRKSVVGYYNSLTKEVCITSHALTEYYERNDVKAAMEVMYHEVGHYVHDTAFKWKAFRFPKEQMTEYAKTNGKENFAEAFMDFFMGENKPERNAKVRTILDLLGAKNVEVVA